jgi:NADPH2:quinone reductase
MAQWQPAFGTAAQYVVVPQERAVPVPENSSFEEGACLGIPAMTAHRTIVCDDGVAGQNVLIHGGGGAVGFYAIQFAKWSGARCVAATVSREEQRRHAELAGADIVIDYKGTAVVGAQHGVPRGVFPLRPAVGSFSRTVLSAGVRS